MATEKSKKAGVSSISPSSERLEELWVVWDVLGGWSKELLETIDEMFGSRGNMALQKMQKSVISTNQDLCTSGATKLERKIEHKITDYID